MKQINIRNPILFACAQACTMNKDDRFSGVFVHQDGSIIGMSNAIYFEAKGAVEPFTHCEQFMIRLPRIISTKDRAENAYIEYDEHKLYLNDQYTYSCEISNFEKFQITFGSDVQDEFIRNPGFSTVSFSAEVLALIGKVAGSTMTTFKFEKFGYVDELDGYADAIRVYFDSLNADSLEYKCIMMPSAIVSA